MKNLSKNDSRRINAEAWLVDTPSADITSRSAEGFLHELLVHKIELEMQNEQLRQSQVALEESRDRYVDFYDFSPVGYLTLNLEGMIEEISLTGAAMLGVERNQLPCRRFSSFVATEDRDRWHRYFLNVINRNDTLACELTLQHDGGPCFYARLFCLCLKNGGKESVVRVVLTDAQLEKGHRQALRDLEYQKFALDQHSIVAITDVSGTILYANDKFCAISQYSRGELLGQNHRMINSGFHPKEFFHDMYRTIAAGTVWHGDICNRAKDGSLYWVETTIVPNIGSDGKPFQYVAIRTDITERMLAEESLRKSEENYRTLFENMLDGYAHCRMVFENGIPQDFVYLNVNINYEKLTGLKDVVGKKVSEVIPGIHESNPELFEIYGRVALTGQPEKFETFVESLRIWFSVSVHSTEKEHFVAIFQDITERKQSEQELIVLNNQLTHEVTKRTSELSSLTAHIQKIAETERANLARELHDELGSTLAGIRMEVGRLIKNITDPERLKDLSEIKELLANASGITRNVINQLYPTFLDTYGFVAGVEWLVKEFKKHSGIEVELQLPQEVVMEPTFALAAYRITQECLTNIAKHAEASKVSIEVRTSGNFLDLTIHDNGKGILREISVNRHGIVGMIERARNLGGSMEIGSDKGKGTTAHFRLPLSAATTKKKKVLVVDDHAIVRNALRQLLDRETDDFSVEGEATDGKVAVQMAIDGDWDIMLLDINLPKKNGIQVLEEIMAVKPNLPIIMLSSHSEEEYGEIALSKGATCYIEKGETDKLVEAMRRATINR